MSSVIFLIAFPYEVYLSHHMLAEASRYSHLVSAIDPSYESYYSEAICALHSENVEKSITLFQVLPFRHRTLNYYRGVSYYRQGNYTLATYYFEQATGLWQAQYYMGLLRLKHGHVHEAMAYVDQTLDSVNTSVMRDYVTDYSSLVNARDKYIQGLYDEAIDLYEDVSHFFGYREIGYAYAVLRKREYERSIALCDTVIRAHDDRELVAQALLLSADAYTLLHDYQQARDRVRKYLAMREDDEAYYLLGKTFVDDAHYDSAAHYFRNLPDSIDKYLFYKGRTQYFLDVWGKSEELLLRHRETFPGSPFGDRALYILASINYKRKEYNAAIDFWQELIGTYAASTLAPPAQKGIGDAYFETRDYQKALTAYRTVERYTPSPLTAAEALLKIYEVRYHMKRYASLREALSAFVSDHPHSPLGLATRIRIAQILYDDGEYYQSLVELDNILELYPDSAATSRVFIEKARAYEALSNQRETKKAFRDLLMYKYGEAYYSYAAHELGRIYVEEAQYDSALYYYNILLQDEKYRERALFEIAKLYDILGQYDESEVMIDKLILEFPSSAFLYDATLVKAKSYKNRGFHQKAITILKDSIKKLGEKPEIYVEIGNIFFEIEDFVNARKNYLSACERFSQRRDDAARTLMLAGDAALAIGDRNKAREHYLQANLVAESSALKDKATTKIRAVAVE